MKPIIILVCPQMGENIGMVARAMANFALHELRLVHPRDGWPNKKAYAPASGASNILDQAKTFETLQQALHDVHFSYALTARQHGQIKPVFAPKEAVKQTLENASQALKTAFVFGRERNGLTSEEVGLCDAIVTFPLNPQFTSLNLAQAVMLVAYEWFQLESGRLPFASPPAQKPADKAQLFALFERLEAALQQGQFFHPPEKKEAMLISLRNVFTRLAASEHDIALLNGVITHLTRGIAPIKELAPQETSALRALILEQAPTQSATPLRGLTKLLRRNPTKEEKSLWDALVQDRRFTHLEFKRATPVGPYILDFVSFKNRAVIEIEREESEREKRHAWLQARGYRIKIVSQHMALENPQMLLNEVIDWL